MFALICGILGYIQRLGQDCCQLAVRLVVRSNDITDIKNRVMAWLLNDGAFRQSDACNERCLSDI